MIAICEDDFRRAGIELVLELAAASHHLNADPIRFQQAALEPPSSNAIKFYPSGRPGDGAHSRPGVKPPGAGGSDDGCLVVQVSDTGIGIEADAIDRIFEIAVGGSTPETRKYGGLGLGLDSQSLDHRAA